MDRCWTRNDGTHSLQLHLEVSIPFHRINSRHKIKADLIKPTSQAPAVGWSNPYQIGILVASVVVLGIFALWESYSEAPIMPLDVWKAPSFLPLMLAVLMSFMSFGVSRGSPVSKLAKPS